MPSETLPENHPASHPAPVLILGADRDIGLHLARRLVEEKRPVILSFRHYPDEAVKLRIGNPELVTGVFALDARTASAMERFFERVRETTPRLYALVNCIGPWAEKSLLQTTDDDFEAIINGNVLQAFHACRRAYPLLDANGGGRIVHFTFAGVEKQAAYRDIAAYAAAKTALLSLTRSLAVEWAARKITVNAVAPGVVATDTLTAAPAGSAAPPAWPLIPMEAIWQAVRFLLSDAATHVTGTNLTVSAGFGWR